MLQISENSQRKIAKILQGFFLDYRKEAREFFRNALIYVPENFKIEESKNFDYEYLRLMKKFSDPGYWLLVDDSLLGKITPHDELCLDPKNKTASKILDIFELDLKDEYGSLNGRKIAVALLQSSKTYKNLLKPASEITKEVLFFDVQTGMKILKYSLKNHEKDPRFYLQDLQNCIKNYPDENLSLRTQLVSMKPPLREFPLERILKHLVNPKHYAQQAEHQEMLEKLNEILKTENIQLQYHQQNQTISFTVIEQRNKDSSHNSENQVFALDSISNNITEIQCKIEFLFDGNKKKAVFIERLKELEVTYKNNCFLSTVVVLGSIVEGLLKNHLLEHEKQNFEFKNLPMDIKNNSLPKPVKALNFKEMIDVHKKNNLLSSFITDLLDPYRDFRNHIHIHHSETQTPIGRDICEIGFRVLKMLAQELYDRKNNTYSHAKVH